jgi:hypothetical protein
VGLEQVRDLVVGQPVEQAEGDRHDARDAEERGNVPAQPAGEAAGRAAGQVGGAHDRYQRDWLTPAGFPLPGRPPGNAG